MRNRAISNCCVRVSSISQYAVGNVRISAVMNLRYYFDCTTLAFSRKHKKSNLIFNKFEYFDHIASDYQPDPGWIYTNCKAVSTEVPETSLCTQQCVLSRLAKTDYQKKCNNPADKAYFRAFTSVSQSASASVDKRFPSTVSSESGLLALPVVSAGQRFRSGRY